MLLYATPDDLTSGAWLNDTPDNANALLRSASGLVRTATAAALYDVDPAGKPADPEVVDAFRDATCAQVAMWTAANIDPINDGAPDESGHVMSRTLGGRSERYSAVAQTVTVQQDRATAARELCTEARNILFNAGLLYTGAGS